MSFGDLKGRSHQYTYGLDAVSDELSVNVWGDISPSEMDEYDIVLTSFTSPMDVLGFVDAVKEPPRSARLIIGGQGVYAFTSWAPLVSRIMFGRAEGIVDRIVLDKEPSKYCFDYASDPEFDGKYEIRRPRELLLGESTVGCGGACRFCQYRATRGLFGGSYTAAGRGHQVTEDRWENIVSKSGRQTTALDGLSELTRKKVGKPVSDEMIIDTLSRLLADNHQRPVVLKIFMIVGYPWETAESVKDDILHLREVLSRVRKSSSRIMIMFTFTPFSPEPLTLMENEPANIATKWRDILLHDDFRCVYDSPHLNAFTLPQIPGPLTLYRRGCVNRGLDVDRLRQIISAKTIEDAVSIGGDLHCAGAGHRVSNLLKLEPRNSK